MEKPNYENEQIRETDSKNQLGETSVSHTPKIADFWQRSLLMNGLGWLGAIAFLSSSIVWVENSHSGIAFAAPEIPEIMPKAAPDIPAPPAKEPEPEPVFIRRTPTPSPSSSTSTRTRSQNRVTQSRSNSTNTNNTNSNSYIDPTDYSIGATNRRDIPGRSYQPPSAVVFQERYKPNQRVVPQSPLEEPSTDVAAVRRRGRRSAMTARRGNASLTQISRAPRTYDIERPDSAEISRVPRIYEIERNTRRTQNSRVARTYEIERITLEPLNRISQRRSNQGIENPETTKVTRRRGTTLAAANQIRVSAININSNGMRISRAGVIRRGETQIASTNTNGLIGSFRNDRNSRNQVLNYYYNSINPSDSSNNESNRTNLALIFPLAIPAQITSVFGWRIHPITGERGFHAGTDIGAPMGTPVLAAHAGKVALADFLGGYGLAVVLRHNQDAQETRYGHLSEVTVKPGDWVEQGTVIGRVGDSGHSNGPHLHFEVREQTPQGWVAKDPGVQLEYSLARLVRAFQSGQATVPQDIQSYEMPPNTLQKEKLSPQVPIPSAELPEISITGTDSPPPLLSAGN
ncbi:M23 family metallopeptidase [Floridanema evergladense]|uniref:M23 family metallopeptidase n=1 Tax=Floridaenema evergladense BLCC-F167 TaxID=3153639 RepID=A0ABV4WWX8_9CYAN